MYLPISFRVTSPALRQSYDGHNAFELTLKDVHENNWAPFYEHGLTLNPSMDK